MLNQEISLFFNSFLFKSSFFDYFIYFCAQILPFILFFYISYYFLFIKRQANKFLLICFIVLTSLAFSEIFKFIFSHPRPFLGDGEFSPLFLFGGNDSFPSGHATVSMAMAIAVFYENRKIGILFLICAVIISIARVVSGVHYFFDILAGMFLGFILVYLGYKYAGKLKNSLQKRED